MRNHLKSLYTKVRKHLLTQGVRSTYTNKYDVDTCAYRSKEGHLSCAVGCLIKDEYYNVTLESHAADYTDVVYAVQQSLGYKGLSSKDVDLLIRLQGIHDNRKPDTWKVHLDKVAEEFGITQ